MKNLTLPATFALLAALTACGGNGEASETTAPVAAPELTPEEDAAPPAVYDDDEVIDHLGVEVRPDGDDVPPDFLFDDGSYIADYRWESQDGEVCFLSNIITSAGEADTAGSSKVLDPTGSAGIEFYAGTENLATCSDLLKTALAGFPS